MNDVTTKDLTEREFKVVGTRPLRPDGVDKVTGRAKFGADLHVANMLVGKVLRSPHAHARIKVDRHLESAGLAWREGGGHRRPTSAICPRNSFRQAR